MRTVAFEAGRDRSSWIIRFLDRPWEWVERLRAALDRKHVWWRRLLSWLLSWVRPRAVAVFGATVLSIVIAVIAATGPQRAFRVDENHYVAVAAFFVVALAVERAIEVVVAPWVGRGDRAIDRNILIGSFGLVIAVTLAALIGLNAFGVLIPNTQLATGTLERTVGLLVAGLAAAGSSKPLHDLTMRLERNVRDRKAALDAERSGERGEPRTGTRRYRIGFDIENRRTPPDANGEEQWARDFVDEVGRLLPGWTIDADRARILGDPTLEASTFIDAAPGTPEHRRQIFSAAHRIESQEGLEVTSIRVPPSDVQRADETPTPAARWALKAIGLDSDFYRAGGGGIDPTGRPVKIAVLDTGVRPHPDGVSADRVVDDDDVLGPDSGDGSTFDRIANWVLDDFDFDPFTSESHATAVASVIASGGDETLRATDIDAWWRDSPMVGVAPDAEIASVRVMRGQIHIGDDDVARGVDTAVQRGADVISMSLGGFGFEGLESAIDRAVEEGTIVVCASGNAFNVVVAPAYYGTTVALAGVTPTLEPYESQSSRGPEIDVSAPGHQVWRANFRDGVPVVERSSGTTYATAVAAGAAGLWLAHHGRDRLRRHYPGILLPQLFKRAVRASTDAWPPADGLSDDWGTGIVNVPQLLDFDIFTTDAAGNEVAKFTADELNEEFIERSPLDEQDRVLGGLAAVFSGRGTLDIRADLVEGAASIPGLLVTEAGSIPVDDTGFHDAAAAGNRADLPIPASASPELRTALDEASDGARRAASSQLASTPLPPDWGVGFSRPLRRALEGRAQPVRGYRWIGVLALAAAIAVAIGFSGAGTDLLDDVPGVAGLLGFLVIGVYAFAQAVERVIEYVLARRVFRDVPGRETDRALILLGAGILLATVGAVLLDIGLLDSIGALHGDDGKEMVCADTGLACPDGAFEAADALVTGLATGGGAKAVHDLLSRIRLPSSSS